VSDIRQDRGNVTRRLPDAEETADVDGCPLGALGVTVRAFIVGALLAVLILEVLERLLELQLRAREETVELKENSLNGK
jgi:hypothetical protein